VGKVGLFAPANGDYDRGVMNHVSTRPLAARLPAAPRLTVVRAAREVLIIALAVTAYFAVRGYTEGAFATAAANAARIADFERAIGIYREPWIQRQLVDYQTAIDVMNWVYIWGHWPVIFVAACWLFVRRPRTYYVLRNAFLISGGIGLIVFAAFPVAPPRLATPEFVDTITLHSNAYRVLQPPAFVNQYAAMPSLHFGWDLLIGGGIAREVKLWPVRVWGVILPVLMLGAVVITANHFIVDAVAGALLVSIALWAAVHISIRAQGATVRAWLAGGAHD
jgi:PAP2 superfamily